MGTLALAAKITHVPSLYLSELDGPRKGSRQAAIDGLKDIGRRCRALGVDTIVVFDTHWLVNASYHLNCAPHFKVISVSALCTVHYLNDSARLGWAMRKAIEEHYDGTVAFFASGSLSHRFAQNGLAPEFAFKIWSPFLENLDRRVLEMWQAGEWKDFCEMLPEYASKGHGEGFMHDTAMLLGALGWSAYDGAAEIVTPYFGASGTGQLNAVFPVTPQDGRAIPAAQASRADGYTSVATRL